MADSLLVTPLHDAHRALGARMMPFGGFDMPVQYSGIIEEHQAVRTAAGLFDVSHMGEFEVHGPEALALVQFLVTNDAARLTPPADGAPGRAMYAVLCNERGGCVDDLLVYRLPDRDGHPAFLLVVNAANIAKDLAHVRAVHAARGFDCAVEDRSAETGLLALQGPRAFEIAARLTDLPVAEIPYYQFLAPAPGTFMGCERALLSHTGYTGEPGLEIYCEAERVADVWHALLEAGANLGLKPAGLGARDTLRLEAGYSLYGHELDDETTPLEAGLGWVVKPDAKDFVGREALVRQKAEGVPRRIVGFVLEERGIPRQGCALVSVADESSAAPETLGAVTSGTQSPTLGRGIGLGFVPNRPEYTTPGTALGVDVRGRTLRATVAKPPFHKAA